MDASPTRATSEGTRRFSRRHVAAEGYWRQWRGLTLSSLGWGSYLGEVGPEANQHYEEAARAAWESGINVMDTAANYRDGQSEHDLGRALSQWPRRDEVFVVTKGGFLHGDAPSGRDAATYVEAEHVTPGRLQADEIAGGIHAMSPAFLRHELEQSLERLGLRSVDAYLVHNPETQLQAGVPRATFEQRMRSAFEELERQVDAGRLQTYGVATWDGFRVPPEAPHHLDLDRLLRLAREARAAVGAAGLESHFGALELPVNLAMPEAAATPTQAWRGRRVPVLAAAREANLLVLSSASLLQGRLLGRIPPSVVQRLRSGDDVSAAVEFARSARGVTTALVGMSRPEHVRANADRMRPKPTQPAAVEGLLGGGLPP